MRCKVLSEAQVEAFMELGFTRLEEAFPRRQALLAQDFLWEQVEKRGVLRRHQSTWTEPMVHIKESYSDPVFQACATDRLADAVEDLVGCGRWTGRERTGSWGWWPVNFSLGAGQPWNVPTEGWHWDGIHFRHFIDSPEQGLLLLCIFSDVQPRGGGTLVAAGSHKLVARFLQGHPEGLELREAIRLCRQGHPWVAELTGETAYGEGGGHEKPPGSRDRVERFMNQTYVDTAGTSLKVVETTAAAGDVFLCHPLLLHAASPNHSGVPRFMCNRTTPLKERMNLRRENPDDYSAIERSIVQALS